jgi:hypothetical protein
MPSIQRILHNGNGVKSNSNPSTTECPQNFRRRVSMTRLEMAKRAKLLQRQQSRSRRTSRGRIMSTEELYSREQSALWVRFRRGRMAAVHKSKELGSFGCKQWSTALTLYSAKAPKGSDLRRSICTTSLDRSRARDKRSLYRNFRS